jgi:hypothetical protein
MNETLVIAWVRACCADGEGRRLRVAARLSLADVSRACDVDTGTASRWERGLCSPQHAAALRYGAFLSELSALDGPHAI